MNKLNSRFRGNRRLNVLHLLFLISQISALSLAFPNLQRADLKTTEVENRKPISNDSNGNLHLADSQKSQHRSEKTSVSANLNAQFGSLEQESEISSETQISSSVLQNEATPLVIKNTYRSPGLAAIDVPKLAKQLPEIESTIKVNLPEKAASLLEALDLGLKTGTEQQGALYSAMLHDAVDKLDSRVAEMKQEAEALQKLREALNSVASEKSMNDIRISPQANKAAFSIETVASPMYHYYYESVPTSSPERQPTFSPDDSEKKQKKNWDTIQLQDPPVSTNQKDSAVGGESSYDEGQQQNHENNEFYDHENHGDEQQLRNGGDADDEALLSRVSFLSNLNLTNYTDQISDQISGLIERLIQLRDKLSSEEWKESISIFLAAIDALIGLERQPYNYNNWIIALNTTEALLTLVKKLDQSMTPTIPAIPSVQQSLSDKILPALPLQQLAAVDVATSKKFEQVNKDLATNIEQLQSTAGLTLFDLNFVRNLSWVLSPYQTTVVISPQISSTPFKEPKESASDADIDSKILGLAKIQNISKTLELVQQYVSQGAGTASGPSFTKIQAELETLTNQLQDFHQYLTSIDASDTQVEATRLAHKAAEQALTAVAGSGSMHTSNDFSLLKTLSSLQTPINHMSQGLSIPVNSVQLVSNETIENQIAQLQRRFNPESKQSRAAGSLAVSAMETIDNVLPQLSIAPNLHDEAAEHSKPNGKTFSYGIDTSLRGNASLDGVPSLEAIAETVSALRGFVSNAADAPCEGLDYFQKANCIQALSRDNPIANSVSQILNDAKNSSPISAIISGDEPSDGKTQSPSLRSNSKVE